MEELPIKADVTELLEKLYADALQPGTKEVGKAIGTVLGLFNTLTLPLRVVNERAGLIFKKNMDKYRERLLSDVQSENICEVRPEVGVPIIEKLTYVEDEDISDLFVNLLVKASSTDSQMHAHPSFSQMINSLTTDEARIIRSLKHGGQGSFAYIYFTRNSKKGLMVKTYC